MPRIMFKFLCQLWLGFAMLVDAFAPVTPYWTVASTTGTHRVRRRTAVWVQTQITPTMNQVAPVMDDKMYDFASFMNLMSPNQCPNPDSMLGYLMHMNDNGLFAVMIIYIIINVAIFLPVNRD
jgi:hypothetical protein